MLSGFLLRCHISPATQPSALQETDATDEILTVIDQPLLAPFPLAQSGRETTHLDIHHYCPCHLYRQVTFILFPLVEPTPLS